VYDIVSVHVCLHADNVEACRCVRLCVFVCVCVCVYVCACVVGVHHFVCAFLQVFACVFVYNERKTPLQ